MITSVFLVSSETLKIRKNISEFAIFLNIYNFFITINKVYTELRNYGKLFCLYECSLWIKI